MNYAVYLHSIYNTVLIIPRPERDVLDLIDVFQEMSGVKLSRCVIEAVPDPKTGAPRTLWAFSTFDPELVPLVEEVLGLSPNPHLKR